MSNEHPLGAALDALGPKPDDEAILTAFMDTISQMGISPYPAQEEAILELMADQHVLLKTPTGSGKSLVATAMHFRATAHKRVSIYTSPIKALVSEKFFSLCKLFGPQRVGMLTGDASIHRDAPILCCTAEILSNMALAEGTSAPVGDVIMDEFHYYSDPDRGMAWQIPLLLLSQTRFLLMSATLGSTKSIEDSLQQETGRDVATVESDIRPVPLDFAYSEKPLHEALDDLVRGGKIPIYVVNFTQRECAEHAQNMLSVDICSKEEKKKITASLSGFRFDSPFGQDVRKYVCHGIGIHHAGLLPKYRLLVERLAQEGLLKIIMGTDTLGVGVNVPIRTVMFTKLCKFDGQKTGLLSVRDFKQISGRAGRKGFDNQGSVVGQAPEHVIENLKAERKAATQTGSNKRKSKVHKKKPPTKNYVPWDAKTFERLQESAPEPLVSRFSLQHGTLLTMLQGSHSHGYRATIELIAKCHERPRQKSRLRRQAAMLARELQKADILVRQNGQLECSSKLQRDFSLHQTLSLFLLEVLDALDPEDPNHALDLLSAVEAILENPREVLRQQEKSARDARYAELKAEGAEYAQLQEELEKISYPKPMADFLYQAQEIYTKAHPWAAQAALRPKSIAREMVETCASFNEYIGLYGLKRSEGVVLRYLSNLVRTLHQGVPKAHKTDAFHDMFAFLRAAVARVDTSLLTAWEELAAPSHDADDADSSESAEELKAQKQAEQERALWHARLRADVHRILRHLTQGDLDALQEDLHPPFEPPLIANNDETEAHAEIVPLNPEAIKQALSAFEADYGQMGFHPAARHPKRTQIVSLDPHTVQIQHRLWDAEGAEDCWLVAVSKTDWDRNKPLLCLTHFGPWDAAALER